MSGELYWQGADNGREGLLKSKKWFETLSILAQCEGEMITDYQSPMYKALFSAMPDESWLGKNHNRSLFRDYQKCWVSFEVLEPTEETDQKIVLTTKGRSLVNSGDVEEFFRLAIDGYMEKWNVAGVPMLVSPYEHIAHAILLYPDLSAEIRISDLQQKTEQLASISVSTSYPLLTFISTDTNSRRFKSYLTVLENAAAIERNGNGTIIVKDKYYLEKLVRDGVLAIHPNAVVMSIDFDMTQSAELPANIADDLRKRKRAYQAVREGQAKFSSLVHEAYNNTCCITGTNEQAVLQAAHILSYMGRQTNFIGNGLLMAVDVHELFDRGKLLINPETLAIELSDDVTDNRYLRYEGQIIKTPTSARSQPNRDALKRKYQLSKSA